MAKSDRALSELYRAAYHAGGHLVARKYYRIPTPRMYLSTRKRLFRRLRVLVAPMPIPDDLGSFERGVGDPFLVATHAGIEAEAQWLSATEGMSQSKARRRARRSERDGDVTAMAMLAAHCKISHSRARRDALAIVRSEWRKVDGSARFLIRSAQARSRRR